MMRAFSCIPLSSYRHIPRRLVFMLCILWLGMACADVQANTFTVTNLSDSGAGSLRQAITDANANAGADTITFANGLTGTITLTSALPNLTDDVTLSGPGAKLMTVARSSAAGTPAFRILTIDNGAATPPTVSISGLTLANGLIQSTQNTVSSLNSYPLKYFGGAVLSNKANVAFSDCAISGNGIVLPVTVYIPDPSGYGYDLAPPPVGFGAGIYNYQGTMTLTRCAVSSNNASANIKGGGLCNDAGTVTLTDCLVTNNYSAATGIGMITGVLGSGAYNYQGTMTLTRCTVSSNTASGYANGGGLYNEAGTMDLTNCTISGNQVIGKEGGLFEFGPAFGGGIWNSGTLNLAGCTLANNSAVTISTYFTGADYGPTSITTYIPGSGCSVYNAGASSATQVNFYQTILVSGSYGQNIVSASGIVLNSLGYNLSNDATGPNDGATDRLNVDAKLSPLNYYGGPTPTHVPLLGSPAIDAGDPNFNGNPATDQRGQPRVFNGRVDIGAVERQAVELIASDDAYSVKHDHTLRTAASGVLANDTGMAPLSAVLVTQPAHGTLTLNAGGSFVYTPNAGYGVAANSTDSFTYAIQDGNGRTSNVATVTITILADNPPTLTNSLTGTATAGQAWNFTATATDPDLPDDTLTFALVNAPSGMSINGATGAIAYTQKVAGVVTFGIKVTDRFGKNDMKTFTLTVQSDPNAPVSLSITNVVLGRVNANTVTVSFNVVNSGTGKATNLIISRATLGPWLSVVNSAPVTVEAGGKQAYTLTFSGVKSSPNVVYPLQIRGTYQAQNATQSLFYGGGVLVP